MDDVKHGGMKVGAEPADAIQHLSDSEYLARPSWQSPIRFTKKRNGESDTAVRRTDFEHFSPCCRKAAYAQLQVAMTHYKQMEKPDRDRTHARAAEDELQTFLSKYRAIRLPRRTAFARSAELLAEGDSASVNYY